MLCFDAIALPEGPLLLQAKVGRMYMGRMYNRRQHWRGEPYDHVGWTTR